MGPARRRRRKGGALAALALCIATATGCELLVPDAVPAFTCRAGQDTCPSDSTCVPATGVCIPRSQACSPGSCPTGEVCDPQTLACEPTQADATPDATIEAQPPAESGDPDADASPPEEDVHPPVEEGDAPGPCRGVGCKCSGGSDCDTQICGDQVTVTGDAYNAAGQAAFCTKPCCTSNDCDPSSVCFATGAGGNYCVPPQWLTRSLTVGTKVGGQGCINDVECRSGLCTSGACADTCCALTRAGSQCAQGTTCRFGTFPGVGFDMHFAARCAAPAGLVANGGACRALTDCQSGFCDALSLYCREPCGNYQDCSPVLQECGYSGATPTGGLVAACGPVQGKGIQGAMCQSGGDCASAFCNPSVHQCTDVCFSDADCTVSGWRCRPMVVQFGGSFSVLSCGS